MLDPWIADLCKRSSSLLWGRAVPEKSVVASALVKVREDAAEESMDRLKKRYSQHMSQCGRSKDIAWGRRIHAELRERGDLDRTTFLGNLLVQMYAQCGHLEEARRVFDRIEKQNVYSWNILIMAFIQNGRLEVARSIFERLVPNRNEVTWTIMATAYAQKGEIRNAQQIFDKMPRWSIMAWNGMMSMHSRVGNASDAMDLFNRLPQRDVVTWNVMITTYALRPQHLCEARKIFDKMPQRDAISWTSFIAALSNAGRAEQAKALFDQIPEQTLPSWNAMLTAYAQRGYLREAQRIFDRMPQRAVISWNSMLAAYAQNGALARARQIFDEMRERDLVSWNSIIAAYAHAGDCETTLDLLHSMGVEGFVPVDVTMVSVLAVCSYAGMFEEGKQWYLSARRDFEIEPPSYEIYLCIIDLLGRSGQLEEAEGLIWELPFVIDAVPWTMLLGACKMHQDVERGSRAAEALVELQPRESATYVLASNIWT